MAIIVEGADYSGKTTLSLEIGKLLQWPVLKNEQERADFARGKHNTVTGGFGYTLARLMIDALASERCFIKDRDYPTELVYNRVMGIEPNSFLLGKMDHIHASLGTLIIYCERRNYDDIGYADQLIDVTQIDAIKRGYNRFLERTDCKHITIYLEDGTPRNNAIECVNWIKAQ